MKEMRIKIDKVSEPDFPRLVTLYNSMILESEFSADLETYTIDQKLNWFDEHQDPRFPILKMEIEREIIGYGYISPWRKNRIALKNIGEISFYVSKEHRKSGHGHRMAL